MRHILGLLVQRPERGQFSSGDTERRLVVGLFVVAAVVVVVVAL